MELRYVAFQPAPTFFVPDPFILPVSYTVLGGQGIDFSSAYDLPLPLTKTFPRERK